MFDRNVSTRGLRLQPRHAYVAGDEFLAQVGGARVAQQRIAHHKLAYEALGATAAAGVTDNRSVGTGQQTQGAVHVVGANEGVLLTHDA